MAKRLFLSLLFIGCIRHPEPLIWNTDYKQVCNVTQEQSRVVQIGGCDWRGVCSALLQNNEVIYKYMPVLGEINKKDVYDCKFIKREVLNDPITRY